MTDRHFPTQCKPLTVPALIFSMRLCVEVMYVNSTELGHPVINEMFYESGIYYKQYSCTQQPQRTFHGTTTRGQVKA